MQNIIVDVSRETRMVTLSKYILGVDAEHLQYNLVFKFEDEFIDGTARLEYEIDGDKNFIMLEKVGESYVMPVKNILTKEGQVNMQLVITEGEKVDDISVFKSNIFYFRVNESINAESEAPKGYLQWLEIANAKLNEIDYAVEKANNLDLNIDKVSDTATIEITKKDGSTKSVEIKDGAKGDKGEPNTLTIGEVIKGEEANATITGDSPNQILNLVLPKGDKGDNGEKGEQGRPGKDGINGKDGIDGFSPNAKVEQTSDGAKITIIDKKGTTVANVKNGKDAEEYDDTQIWDAVSQNSRDIVTLGNRVDHKQDELKSGTNIKTINNQSILGSGNITIQGGESGTTNYNDLSNKPKINNIELTGNKTLDNLGIQPKGNYATISDLEDTVSDLEQQIGNKQSILNKQDKDNIVKDGLVNNTNTLTDEEQLEIEAWLGLDQNYLTYYNTKPYQVNSDYIPAHKKYVDDAIKNYVDSLNANEVSY